MQNRAPLTTMLFKHSPADSSLDITAEYGIDTGDNKPFICLSALDNDDNRAFMEELAEEAAACGDDKKKIVPGVSSDNSTLILRIKGKMRIHEVISKIPDHTYATTKGEESKFNQFYKDTVEHKEKNITTPRKGLDTSLSEQHIKSAIHKHSNTVLPYEYKNKTVLFKHYNNVNSRKIPEVEALAAAYYRLIMGENSASSIQTIFEINTTSSKNERIGNFITLIDGFIPGKKAYKKNKATLIKAGLAKMLVASYVLEENDLHPNNFGFDKHGKLVRIDFDQSFWRLTARYIFSKAHKFVSIPIKNFSTISASDLLSFPITKDQKPNHQFNLKWISYQSNEDLIQDPDFCNDKWKYFLKCILFHDQSIIKNLAEAYLGSINARHKYTKHLNNRLAELKKVLLDLPEFQVYLLTHPTVINELIQELEDDNEKRNDSELKVNTDAISNLYHQLYLDIDNKVDSQKKNPEYADRYPYLYAQSSLQDTLHSAALSSDIKEQLNKIICHSNHVLKREPSKIRDLTKILEKTNEIALLKKDSLDFQTKLTAYHQLALQADGKPSLPWKLLSAAMMAVGALICAAGITIAIGSLIPTFGMGTIGGAGIAVGGKIMLMSGLRLFCHAKQRRGLSKAMDDLEKHQSKTLR